MTRYAYHFSFPVFSREEYMSVPTDDMSNPLIFEEEVQESPIYPDEEIPLGISRRVTPVVEHFSAPLAQRACKPNYMILVWILVSSILANMLPDSVINGLSGMLPESVSNYSKPVTRAIATVAVYSLLNFLVQ